MERQVCRLQSSLAPRQAPRGHLSTSHFSGEMAKEADTAPLLSPQASAALLRATKKVSVNSNDSDEISFQ